jgi:nucleoside-diphosphate-sugar epimerase
MQAKILLTGSSGFLGKAISHNLALQFAQLLTIGRQPSNGILCDLSVEIPLLHKYNIEVVIHAAGKSHVEPKTKIEKQAFFEANLKGTHNLLTALAQLPQQPKSFVFISSVSVYGLQTGLNITEEIPLLATDPYGLSKIQAEQLVIGWCKKNNVICTILRLPLLAGTNPPGNLGTMIKGIKKGYYFNIAGGKAKKSMVLASDVSKFIIKVSTLGGIYNLTDGYHPCFNELSRTISLQLGRKFVPNMPLFFAKYLAKIGDLIGGKFPINSNKLSKIISPLTFDDTKARKAFGWNPTPVLEGFKITDTD